MIRHSMKLLVALALGCGGCGARDPIPPAREPGELALTAINPDTTVNEIFTVLGLIELAIRRGDPNVLSPAFGAAYVEVACGTVHRYLDGAAAATARLRRGAATGWKVTVSNDGAMAWAISTGVEIVNLEIFEKHGSAWVLVAGAVSAETPAASGCDAMAATSDALPTAAATPALRSTAIARDALLVSCGRWRDMEEGEDSQDGWDDVEDARAAQALDSNANQLIDFAESGTDQMQLSAGAQMGWSVGGPPSGIGFRSLGIIEQTASGWQITASLWSADPATMSRRCVREKRRGRIVVTDTNIEILDRVLFGPNTSEIAPTTQLILDSVASTLIGTPDILLFALQAHADRGETDPMGISERRGLAVRQYLRDKGVAIERMEINFYGDGVPANATIETDDAGKETSKPPGPADNRRIVFLILKRDAGG